MINADKLGKLDGRYRTGTRRDTEFAAEEAKLLDELLAAADLTSPTTPEVRSGDETSDAQAPYVEKTWEAPHLAPEPPGQQALAVWPSVYSETASKTPRSPIRRRLTMSPAKPTNCVRRGLLVTPRSATKRSPLASSGALLTSARLPRRRFSMMTGRVVLRNLTSRSCGSRQTPSRRNNRRWRCGPPLTARPRLRPPRSWKRRPSMRTNPAGSTNRSSLESRYRARCKATGAGRRACRHCWRRRARRARGDK